MKALIAEMVGMAMFVYTGVGTAHMAARNNPFGAAGAHLSISLAFGLGITCFAYGTAGFSGGHLNPAVTTSLMIIGEIRPVLGVLYVVAQVIGACIGALLAAGADPYLVGFALNVVQPYDVAGAVGVLNNSVGHWEKLDVSEKGDDLMWFQATVVEMMGTFMLVMTVCWTAVSKHSIAGNCAPLAIGLAVFFAHLTAIPITNCSINPARSFGAAVAASFLPYHKNSSNKEETDERIYRAWEHMIFFWVVPILGGAVAALTYRFGFEPDKLYTSSKEEAKNAAKNVEMKQNPVTTDTKESA